LRTGHADLGEGDIEIDASKGTKHCYVYAKAFNTFTTEAVNFYYGPIEDSSNVNKVYYFGADTAVMDAQLLLSGKMISYGPGGGAILNGGCLGMKSFITAGGMADKSGGMVGKTPLQFTSIMAKLFGAIPPIIDKLKAAGTAIHKAAYVTKYYTEDELGDTDTIKNIGFSYRDPPGNPIQYKTIQLKFPEPRWQMLKRFGIATGGAYTFQEMPVNYQGTDTYPWPGKKKWLDDSIFYQLTQLKMFDAGSNYDKDRPGPYEDPQIDDWKKVTMSGNYKLNRPAS
jgi:hypothetical protein